MPPNTPYYEQDNNPGRRWPQCADCGRPYPQLSMDLKCAPCEEQARSGVISWLAAAIVVAVWVVVMMVAGKAMWEWLAR